MSQVLLYSQALYYLLTGLWPILHMPSFLYVTGPKTDLWLVETVGGMLAVSGSALILSQASGGPVTVEIQALAIGDAAVLGFIDFYYVSKACIPKIYLLDGVIELFLILSWLGLTLR